MNYQDKLDEIFADGKVWNHRTFRTVLDPLSSEYTETTMEQKVDFVRKCKDNNLTLEEIVFGYKEYYNEENKSYVVNSIEDGLINLVSKMMTDDK